ncbi:MAG: aldo/keto reductase [Sedimenticola sp.]|nr:aldo/keto reductase [Sedimenticola sp.]
MNRKIPLSQTEWCISRRRFIRLAAVAGMLGALGPAAVRSESSPLIRRPIPSSGELLPVVGLGTARTFDVDTADSAALAPLRDVLQAFYQGGGRLVDSSPMYGNAESVVGRLAADLAIADELFMATKVWTRGREAGIRQIERSARRMGGGPLELVQVHNLLDTETHLDTLAGWKREGRIRYLGITHYTDSAHDRLARLCQTLPLDFVQFNYSILERNAEQRLLPAAIDNGVATLINKPFLQGSLFRRVRGEPLPGWAAEMGIASWGQFFLKFIIGHPGVTCVIPATSKPKHARDNIAAAHGEIPGSRERQRMADHIARL